MRTESRCSTTRASRAPRTSSTRTQVNIATFIGIDNFKRLFGDPQVGEAVRVTSIFVLMAVPLELVLGFLLAILFNQHIFGRPVLRAIMILPIFATPLAVGYTFFTIFYEVGGPLAWTAHPLPVQSDLGAVLGHPRRCLAVDAILFPRVPCRPPGRAGRTL